MINREQAHLIAELARTVRPAWDTRGIVATIETISDRDLADVATATLRAAANPAIRLPAGIALAGPHWPDRQAEATRIATRTVRDEALRIREQAIANCAWCDNRGRLPSGHLCTHDQDPQTRAETAHMRADRARSQIRPAPKPLEPAATTSKGVTT